MNTIEIVKRGICRDCGAPGGLDNRGYGVDCDCANDHHPSSPRARSRERDDDVIRIIGRRNTRWGDKYVLRSPRTAKDAIMALDWGATHRAWDPGTKCWTIDMATIEDSIGQLKEAGWRVIWE